MNELTNVTNQQVQTAQAQKGGSKVVEFFMSPLFAGLLGGAIGAGTALITLKAQKEARMAAEANLKNTKLQARIGGFDKELAAEFPQEVEVMTEEEYKKQIENNSPQNV